MRVERDWLGALARVGTAPGWVIRFANGTAAPRLHECFDFPYKWIETDGAGLPEDFVPFWESGECVYGYDVSLKDFILYSVETPDAPLMRFETLREMELEYVVQLFECEVYDEIGQAVLGAMDLGEYEWDRLGELGALADR